MKKRTTTFLMFALLMITGNNILKAQRITVTIAGTGDFGYSGDWGTCKQAKINQPMDVCMDALHNIYFVDQGNNRIRKVSAANGIITTIAGGGSLTVDGIPATSASLSPNYMCIDATGNLYVSTSNQVRKIEASTGIITIIAGTAVAGYGGDGGPATVANLNSPLGICIDVAGNIYIVDGANYRIRKVTAATGIITTIAGSGYPGHP